MDREKHFLDQDMDSMGFETKNFSERMVTNESNVYSTFGASPDMSIERMNRAPSRRREDDSESAMMITDASPASDDILLPIKFELYEIVSKDIEAFLDCDG